MQKLTTLPTSAESRTGLSIAPPAGYLGKWRTLLSWWTETADPWKDAGTGGRRNIYRRMLRRRKRNEL
jgi:hypothetical protein